MCTPSPPRALRQAASVATRVLPSPVRISAMRPSWSTSPPMSCTSKWRISSARRPASRTAANASGIRASNGSPAARRPRRASVTAASAASSRPRMSDSSSLTAATVRRYRRRRRSLRDPITRCRMFFTISSRCSWTRTRAAGRDAEAERRRRPLPGPRSSHAETVCARSTREPPADRLDSRRNGAGRRARRRRSPPSPDRADGSPDTGR